MTDEPHAEQQKCFEILILARLDPNSTAYPSTNKFPQTRTSTED
jgi:hypothetical protein